MNVATFESTGAVFVLVTSADGGFCLAGCERGLLISRDRGLTWAQHSTLLENQPITSVALSPAGGEHVVLISVTGGILRSANDEAWRTADLGRRQNLAESSGVQISGLAFSPNFVRDPIVFAATVEDGVLRSGDGGRSFHAWNFGLLDLQTFALALSPNFARDETLYVGTASGLFRSRNGGRAWREIESGLPADLTILTLAAERGGLTVGSEAHGIWRSQASEPWRQLPGSEALGAINGLTLASEDDATLYVAAEAGVLRYSAPHGFESLADETPAALCVACTPDAILAGTAEAGVWRFAR